MTEPTIDRPVPAPPSVDAVRGMLGGVLDPELKASIVDLGMVDDVTIAPDGTVTVHIALTTLGCPLQGERLRHRPHAGARTKRNRVLRVDGRSGIPPAHRPPAPA